MKSKTDKALYCLNYDFWSIENMKGYSKSEEKRLQDIVRRINLSVKTKALISYDRIINSEQEG